MENSQNGPSKKKPKPPHHPHDMLFKAVFKRPNNVREVLEAEAPADLLAILKLEKLRLSDASYVDEFLAEEIADVVLACETVDKEEVELAMILEHKSYVPTNPPHQVMRYQNRGWGRQMADKKSDLVPIVPFIFYHGDENWKVKPWPAYLKGYRKELQLYTPHGGYIFIDLSEMSDEKIKRFRSGFLKTALLLMKHRLEREFLLNNLREIVNFVESDEKEDADIRINNLRHILRYLQGLQSIKWKEAQQKLRGLKYTQQVMNLDEIIRTEAYEEGHEVGIEKGIDMGEKRIKCFGTYNMLLKDIPVDMVCNILNLSKKEVMGIKKLLPLAPKIEKLLKQGKLDETAIAKKLKINILFVEAVKQELKKK